MSNTVLLDNVTHMDLRVRTGYAAEFGDNLATVLVFPTEFADIQREYPILFRRDDNGDLQAMALLGLARDENLFLDDNGWNARYVPAVQQRGPFLIGLHGHDAAGDVVAKAMVHVDLDHPRISRTEGEAVFLEHGGNSPYLERVSRILQIIHTGAEAARPMFAAFEEAGLIEDMNIEIDLGDGTKYVLPDFLTISEERLAALDGAALEKLNRAGYLHLAMLVVTSLGNIAWLIELKNRKRALEQA